MPANRLAFAALAVACIGAAAGGGYLASRQSSAPVSAAPVSAPVSAALVSAAMSAPGSAASSKPVQETEAIVGGTAEAPPAGTAPPSRPLPVAPKRSEVPTRAAALTSDRATQGRSTRVGSADPLPTLERTWPAGAENSAPSTQPAGPPGPATGAASAEASQLAPRPDDRAALPEPPRAPEPPQRSFADLVVSADSVIGLQAETLVSSEHARIEDRVEGRVTRDVRVRDTVVIPAGARAMGSVVLVDRGGRFKQTARLGIRFNTLVLADGTRLPIQTETIFREGSAPGNDSAAKVGGGAVAGAILGAILGGGKGAAIGAAAGAGAGSGVVMAGDRSAATIRPGEPVTVRLTSPVTVTVERK
jgi:hypothetical protein